MLESRKGWLGALFACLVVLAATTAWVGARPSNAQVPAAGGDWQHVPNVPADVDFHDVFMADATSGIAVGRQGDKGAAYELQWTAVDGSHSSLQTSPINLNFDAPLHAAVMVNGDVWVVGEQGLIVHKHDGIWSELTSPVPDAQLLTLQMLGDGSEGWAGGFERRPGSQRPTPVLLHFTKGVWKRDTSITGEGTIYALHFGPGGGWAVGDVGIWRYFKGEWTKEQEPNPCPETGCFPTYYSVRAINGDEAWVAGYRMGLCGICVPEPYILHREGGRWRIAVNIFVAGDPTHPGAGIEIKGLTFSASDPDRPALGWAVGSTRHSGDFEPYILSHDGSQAPSEWHYVPYPAGVSAELTSVSAPDRDHAVAVGTRGTIFSSGYGQQQAPTFTPVPASTAIGGPTPPPAVPGGTSPVQ
ncbi:MAG TPA: hypothetical protein VEY08_01770, partial [Chloroflexia bacterium]|nr:hypothetical protein [Chloroflexia bacterium]